MLNKKTLIIGLDCLSPYLFFDKFFKDLPNISKMAKNSLYGRMRSTVPPITSPAWMSMMTSRTPGDLGIYGFRNRSDNSYEKMSIVTSLSIKDKTVWDYLGSAGKKSIAIGVPPSYPPKKINGIMTGCFLAPDDKGIFAYPKEICGEIKEKLGEYRIDVRDFRTDDKDRLLQEIYSLTTNRFGVAQYLLKNKQWDFFMFVDMGTDRLHHGFWRFCDPEHNKFVKNNKYKNVFKDYYLFLDKKVGELMSIIDKDTTVYIVSDHGAKKIDGCFCINEWLIKKGYLKLKEYPDKVVKLTPSMIDWDNTYAWGEGGYYGRVFFNIKGREPKGIIKKSEQENFIARLKKDLNDIEYINSKADKTIVYEPGELYGKVNGVAPDLLVFFGDLFWRSAGKVGFNSIYTFDNDTGPDDANHDWCGVFMMYDKSIKKGREIDETSIYDIAPTILNNMGLAVPKTMRGKPLKIKS
ncbi:MAG: alkaline phosphatase family protein [Candidatus Omnitrophica bacterium]|nr:alkaline phosphatase family protein [Candidatus Omnitrophota bacterium]MDD5081386.1 alkaline phosphatase family protein [Candidatus Omnitrophota bacterium]MDD5440753.1 alkaline phosphatase family protein [Candidatus Omnitrophota bacterium]